ncbi:hypothetical protein [Fimbriimonas ginsengisoli]|uniref:Uncharacterized protein n=1 Tax=Fimbriimonas ginsengisoli Gsoil 348 TaxID=661478 RepID=A0A068NR80_FIMGI|nr:hypothetical protein [Fimbriimonas ginsengisoli]AIE85946.1 hypothetical protein OP10G_2578 [Fimbriimonas ginsengisoli Gsoil 348]
MNSAEVVVPIDSKVDRIAGVCVLAVFVLSPPVIYLCDPTLLGLSAFLALIAWPTAFVLRKHLFPGWKKSLHFSADQIGVSRRGEILQATSWDDIRRFRLKGQVTAAQIISLLGDDGQLLATIPLPANHRSRDVLGLIAAFAPGRPIEQEVPGQWGTRTGHIARAVAGLGLGSLLLIGAWLGITFHQTSTEMMALLGKLAGFAALAGMTLVAVGIVSAISAFAYDPAKVGAQVVQLTSSVTSSLVPCLRAIEAGTPLPVRRCFAYPDRIRAVNLRMEKVGTAVVVALCSLIFLVPGIAIPLTLDDSGVSPILSAVFLAASAGLIYYGIRYYREVKDLVDGLGDSLLIDNDNLMLLRRGRCLPVAIASPLTPNMPFRSHLGLNAMRLKLDTGEETVWYDPSSMVEVDFVGGPG